MKGSRVYTLLAILAVVVLVLVATRAEGCDTPQVVAGKMAIAMSYWKNLDAAGRARILTHCDAEPCSGPEVVHKIMYPRKTHD